MKKSDQVFQVDTKLDVPLKLLLSLSRKYRKPLVSMKVFINYLPDYSNLSLVFSEIGEKLVGGIEAIK